MALGEFTKQLAQQALLSATKDPPAKEPVPATQADNIGATILGQVGAMQKALKEDEELALHFQNGSDTIRVLEIFLPSPRGGGRRGADQSGVARVIAPVHTERVCCPRRAYFRPSMRRRPLKARTCPRPYVRNCCVPKTLLTVFVLPLLVMLLNPKRQAHM